MPEKKSDKKIVQDIMPSGRRTIRNVSFAETTKRHESGHAAKPERRQAAPVHSPSPRKKRRFPGIIVTFIIVFISIAIIAVALSLLYSKASVMITPKKAEFLINGTFTAKKYPSTTATSTRVAGELYYEVITKSGSENQIIVASDGPFVETKAKGTVYLYNEQNTQQKIIAGTRLSNFQDLIYRTSATVVIPAKKDSTPGAVSVEAVADKAGGSYNMTVSGATPGFKIVAYKGTPKYETVYAKIKTDITGGFSGNKKIISPEALKATVKNLQSSLSKKLAEEVKQSVPKGYVFYEGGQSIEYEFPEPITQDKGTASVVVNGIMSGVIFKKDSLLKFIANKELDKFPSPSYEVRGMEDLQLSLINAKDFSARKASPFIFSLKGPITLVGTLSEEALKNELKGTYLKESNAIFAHYPAISNAYALITPFWMRSFPNAPEKIAIEIRD